MQPKKWLQEPNHLDWIDKETGLRCCIMRQVHGKHLCGYVEIPKTHILHKLTYRDQVPQLIQWKADQVLQQPIGERGIFTLFMMAFGGREKLEVEALFDVHGSLTFSGELSDRVGKWYGFDCAHSGDLSPGYQETLMDICPELLINRYDEYRDMEYVKMECECLALQIKELGWWNILKNYPLWLMKNIFNKIRKINFTNLNK